MSFYGSIIDLWQNISETDHTYGNSTQIRKTPPGTPGIPGVLGWQRLEDPELEDSLGYMLRYHETKEEKQRGRQEGRKE